MKSDLVHGPKRKVTTRKITFRQRLSPPDWAAAVQSVNETLEVGCAGSF